MRDLFHQEPLSLIGLTTLVAFYVGGFARRLRLPSLIGFMLLGILLGPSLLDLFDETRLEHFSFITEMALGFVAFGIGAELSMKSLRSLGNGIIGIIFAESLGAFVVVTLAVFAVTRSWPISILFGAVAPASAPAGTVAVIQEYRARGTLTKALYAVVGFDDGLAILIFGLAAALSKTMLLTTLGIAEGGGNGILLSMQKPILEILLSIGLGAVLGFLFCQCVRRLDAPRDMLIMIFGFVVLASGICEHFHLSLILTNMMIGFILVNTRRQALVHKVIAPLQDVMPLVFLLFFCLAGAHLQITELAQLGGVGVVYILARSAGLIGGSRIGARFGHVDDKIRKYIGLGILSQAGVAIGLALIVRHDMMQLMRQPGAEAALKTFAEAHPDLSPVLYDPLHIGAALITTITATCIVFEIVGPILTKMALTKAGEIPGPEAQK